VIFFTVIKTNNAPGSVDWTH